MQDDFGSGGAFVLGGSGSLGGAICRAFADAGVPVAFSYHQNEQAAAALIEQFDERGVAAHAFALDARDRNAVDAALAQAADALGGVHSAVYAGGPGFEPAFFSETDDDTWRRWLEGDVLAAIHLAQAAIPHLRKTHGALVALTTYQGAMIEVRGGISAISKAAVDRMVAVMAREEGRYGVRANSLRCGWIESELNSRLFEKLPDVAARKHQAIPLGRLGKPEEIGQAVVFLCSRRAGFITGVNLVADGGESL